MAPRVRVAVPSEQPGGMEAGVSAHFGHCELYTLVDVEDGAVVAVEALPNIPHEEGGCLAPVQYLASHGVCALIAGGMGMRPLLGFQQAGIQVFYGAGAPSVGAAVQAFLAGRLPQFSPHNTCGGGGGGCGGHH
ncbi:MAG: Dinitrogenase iron-molybdenum cofactor biosynthesis protein [Desulfomicrobiaceae bacterium]|nr:NifB/NifX family molybdenum-iron cluster-binding protein [Desulfomicrobiaceae bacterium]MBZ4685577.1 Dinitrogenase iron-molybdenum cofactor biosynthesis protein [Desulfomicrobiaceae bacterium]MDK2874112.1 hypothetical protein [Desulfomicrobiaceae bacterium]HCF05222.1 dinitrogenase iron-molybdenum cofactor biosynthesis protein [Desulfomicrobiaceae bacterium]